MLRKENGYRSLHLTVTVPVFLSDRILITPVEIQLRTIGMDMWASLEHSLSYKNETSVVKEECLLDLSECSNELASIEKRMQAILKRIEEPTKKA